VKSLLRIKQAIRLLSFIMVFALWLPAIAADVTSKPKILKAPFPAQQSTASEPDDDEDEDPEQRQLKAAIIKRYTDSMEQVRQNGPNLIPDCLSCNLWLAGQEQQKSQESTCSAFYKGMYRKDVVEMRLTFGYTEVEKIERDKKTGQYDYDLVDDRYMGIAAKEMLKKPCATKAGGACGFSPMNPNDKDEDVFWKEVMGPDGKRKTVKVRITTSSYNPSDQDNRVQGFKPVDTAKMKTYSEEDASIPEQKELTAYAKRIFLEGLSGQSAVNLYVGHGRGCAGPSFGPSKRAWSASDKGALAFDKKWYEENYPAKTEMAHAILFAAEKPSLVGLYGCNAQECFGAELAEFSKHTALVLPSDKAIHYPTAVAQAFATLDAALAQRCETSFEQEINTIKDPMGLPTPRAKMTKPFPTTKDVNNY
jgi:hypothetical protein